MKISRAKAKAETAKKVRELRESLGLKPGEFAEKIGISRVAILRWEDAVAEPSPANFIELAGLAGTAGIDLEWFLNKAGFSIKSLRALVPEMDKSFRQFDKRLISGDVARIPVVDGAYFDQPYLPPRPEQIRRSLPLPAEVIENPSATVCVVVEEPIAGTIFDIGDLLVVDRSILNLNDLFGEAVLIDFPERQEDAEWPRSQWPSGAPALGLLTKGKNIRSGWAALFTPLYRRLPIRERISNIDPLLWQGSIPLDIAEEGSRFSFSDLHVLGRAVIWIRQRHENRAKQERRK